MGVGEYQRPPGPQGVNPLRDRGPETAKRRKAASAVTCGHQNIHAGWAFTAQSEENNHPNVFSPSR